MLRNFVALAILALAGVSILPEPSYAGPGGIRGGFRGGGFRGPLIIHRHARAGVLRAFPQTQPRVQLPRTAQSLAKGFAQHQVGPGKPHHFRRHHRGHISGWLAPLAAYDAAYLAAPYDPAGSIPVYALDPADDTAGDLPRPPAPWIASLQSEDREACRSERVTVPAFAGDGDREITVIRC